MIIPKFGRPMTCLTNLDALTSTCGKSALRTSHRGLLRGQSRSRYKAVEQIVARPNRL